MTELPRRLTYVPLASLKSAKRNAKKHDLAALRASISAFGWTAPIEVDERTGRMVAGHGRLEALIAMRAAGDACPAGIVTDDDGEWLVPVMRGWSSADDADAEAYILAANKITENGGYDNRMLAAMLEDVTTQAPELLDATGFEFADFEELLRRVDPADLPSEPFQIPEPFKKPEQSEKLNKPDADLPPDPATVGVPTEPDTRGLVPPEDAPPGLRVACPSCAHEFSI